MLPPTTQRVSHNTTYEINHRIQRRTEEQVARYMDASPREIEMRLAELDREWDVERYLGTMAPALTLTGLLLGLAGKKRWLLLPIAVQAFFLNHSLKGWCPPLPLLRRLGIRTTSEIEQERYALKALRGDFQGVSMDMTGTYRDALAAARPNGMY